MGSAGKRRLGVRWEDSSPIILPIQLRLQPKLMSCWTYIFQDKGALRPLGTSWECTGGFGFSLSIT